METPLVEKPRNLSDIDSLSGLTPEAFRQILQGHFKTPNVQIENPTCDFEAFTGNNDYYNSQIKKITIRARVDGQAKVLPMIVKVPTDSAFVRNNSANGKPFMKENAWYSRLAPELGRGPAPELAAAMATMYLGSSNYDEYAFASPPMLDRLCFPCAFLPGRKKEVGFLTLENLQEKAGEQYKMFDKNKVLSVAHVKMALQTLAHLHGSSWQVIHGQVDPTHQLSFTGEQIINMLKLRVPIMLWSLMLKKCVKFVEKLLKSREEDPELIQRVQHWRKNVLGQKICTFFQSDTGNQSKVNTVIHGDFWSNNIMFHENERGEPQKVKLLDFQMLQINHPAFDLGYFLYVGTDWAFRKAHLQECLEHYFATFSSYLKPSGLKYSFEDFFQEYKERRHLYALGFAVVMPLVLSPSSKHIMKWSDIKKIQQQNEAELFGFDKEEDHPMSREIRRRILDAIHEYDEEKVF